MTDEAHRRSKDPEELKRLYEEFAPRFDRFEPVERWLTGRQRRRLFSRVEGRVLDVACGTGANFPYLPADVDLVGVDLSPAMLERARKRAEKLGLDADLREADAVALPFDDDSFDSVISSLSTCTFPDPVGALCEMSRVCAPDGKILLFEHGRSSAGPIARVQDLLAPAHFERSGCRWNQAPAGLVDAAGLRVEGVRRSVLGVFTELIVAPHDDAATSYIDDSV
jgi:ubiquinone/menaquinone biosynthesis C-methylase UbiE